MKKRLIQNAALGVLLFTALNACSDSENVVVSGGDKKSSLTQSEAEALANAVYPPLQTLSSSYTFLLESATESVISFESEDEQGPNAPGPQVSCFETQPNNWYAQKVFGKLYTSIGNANLAIERIGNDNNGLAQGTRDLLTARSRFIRGYNYFQLVQIFGEVPLILSSGSSERTRKSINEVYTQIVEDLTSAISGLPEYDADKSNPTKLAAYTVLSKVYLTWGQNPITTDDIYSSLQANVDPAKPAPDNVKLAKAVEYANLVINSGKYRLRTDFNTIWGVANENNEEVIFSIHHDGDDVDGAAGGQGNHQTHCGYTNPGDARKDPHISYADISQENLYLDHDTRKLFSYATQIEFATKKDDGQAVIDTLTWPVSIVRPGKWIHRLDVNGKDYRADAPQVQSNDIDHIDFRYAEVLLIKAEALFFQNKTSEALLVINELRARAFGAHYEHGGRLSTITAETIYKEWNYEFSFEQKHWTNLVRWRTLLSTIGDAVPNYEYFKDKYKDAASIEAAFPNTANINKPFYAKVYRHLHAKANNLSGKLYRFPIPLGLQNEDLAITPQNPGY